MFKILSAMLFCIAASPITAQHYVNRTGTYKLVSNAKQVKEDTYGTTGEIQVKVISSSKIVVALSVNMGAPAYNSGGLFDTLQYVNNTSVYNGGQDDPTCRIKLRFSKVGIMVTQKQADLNFGCGFGHGVFADGFYKKQSSLTPKLRH